MHRLALALLATATIACVSTPSFAWDFNCTKAERATVQRTTTGVRVTCAPYVAKKAIRHARKAKRAVKVAMVNTSTQFQQDVVPFIR